MSMQTDCIYGYGFVVYASDEALRGFVLKHASTIHTLECGDELLAYERSHPDGSFNPKEDFFDWENEATGDSGFYGIIADVMSHETGITFEFRNPQDGDSVEDSVIILPMCYPWQFNDTEKALTEEKLKGICMAYIADLGGHLAPDYIRLEYFG